MIMTIPSVLDLAYEIPKASWRDVVLRVLKHNDTYKRIDEVLWRDWGSGILPEVRDMFKAFGYFEMNDLKVVILGQDPYPTKGDAMGLCFSIDCGGGKKRLPPSLVNIFKELEYEYGGMRRTNGDLSDWAKQGVLLLNTALSVVESEAGSHLKVWREFTWEIMRCICESSRGVVMMLWGKHAQGFAPSSVNEDILVLTHTHPSPLARKPFVGNMHFKTSNEFLEAQGKTLIAWT